MPTIVRSISAATSNNSVAVPPGSQVDSSSVLLASSPQCLSGSTFPDSDTGYFGSIGIYEGSCDHLEGDYGRRYSVELTDDTEGFTQSAQVACSHIPVDSNVSVSCSESQNSGPGGLKQLETINKEQFVATVDADLGSCPTQHGETVPFNEHHDSMIATHLSDDSLKMYFPSNTTVSDKPPTSDAVGLPDVTSKYVTVQQLLEMNRQRAGLDSAESLVLDHLSPGFDREALTSLATNYCVINECLQLGRVISKQSKSGDNGKRGKTSVSASRDVMSEQAPAVEVSDVSADVIDSITPVKSLSTDPSYRDHIPKDYSLGTTEQLDEDVSAAIYVRGTDEWRFDGGKPAVSQSELGLMYMAREEPHYYSVYSKLRDVEGGMFSTYQHLPGHAAAMGGCTAEIVAATEHGQIQGNITDKDKTDTFNVRYATKASQYLDIIIQHLELSVVHYNSLAVLNEVESGKTLSPYMPAHRAADIQSTVLPLVGGTLSKQKNGKRINVSEAVTDNYNDTDQELLDEDRCGLAKLNDDFHNDGFMVVETKKHRRQQKKLDFEDPTMQNSSLSKSTASFNEIHSDAVQFDDTHTEEVLTTEHSVISKAEESMFLQGLTSQTGTEEGLIQNSTVEVNTCVDEIATVPAADLEIETVPLVQAVVTEETITVMVPEPHGPQKSDGAVATQLELTVPVSTITVDSPASAAKQEAVEEVGRDLSNQNLSSDKVLAGIEILPANVIDEEDKNDDELSQEIPTCVVIKPEVTEQIESDVKTTADNVAGVTERTVTDIALVKQETAVDVSEVAVIRQGAASEPLASNETVRVERLITVAPRAVVKVTVTVEPCAEIQRKDVTDVSQEPAVIRENLGRVEHEPDSSTVSIVTTKAVTEMEAEPIMTVAAVEQVEDDHDTDAVAVSKNNKEVSEPLNSLHVSEISQSSDVDHIFETKISKVVCMPCDEVFAERCVTHYASLAVLGDVENGKVHNRLKASRLLREWGAENVDDIVAYIVGSEAKKHRRRHKHVKRTSESEVSELKAPETGSVNITVDIVRAKSEEKVLWIGEQTEELGAVLSDVEDQSIEEPSDDTATFTVVESRKHRRQRHRHDAEEAWAQYQDDMDAGGRVTEIESLAESQHGPDYIDAESVLESTTDSSDAKGVSNFAAETTKVSVEGIVEVSPILVINDGELEAVHDAVEAGASVVSTQYATEAEPSSELVFGLEHDAKLDSLVEDANVHISDEICEPAAESVVEVVPQGPSAAESVQDVAFERTLSVSDGYVVEGTYNRLYSDVARAKCDVDVVAEPERQTPTMHDLEVSIGIDVRAEPVDALEAASAELSAESVEDVCSKLASEAEYTEVQISSSVTGSPVISPDMMADDAAEFVSKHTEDVRAELSEIIAPSNIYDVSRPVAEATENVEKVVQPVENLLEVPITTGAIVLYSTEPAVEKQQQKAMPVVEDSVTVVDLKSDVELSTAERDAAVPSIHVPGAELPLSASDVQPLTSPSGMLSDKSHIEEHAAESSVEAHVLINCTKISDVETVLEASVRSFDQLPIAENLDLSSSHLVAVEPAVELPVVKSQGTAFDLLQPGVSMPAGEVASAESTFEVSSELNLEFSSSHLFNEASIEPAVELQSTEFALLEPCVSTLAEEAVSDVESTKEPSAELPVADIPVLQSHKAVAEDEQLVADLFNEGVRAVQIRSDMAPGTGIVTATELDKLIPDSQVEITETPTVSRNEDALKKSAVSSAESFIAEILPYYYAALAVLREVERDTGQLLCDPSLHTVRKASAKMSHGITKTSDAGDTIVSAGDQGLSDTVPEIVSNEACESAVPLLDSMIEPLSEAAILSETVQPTDGNYLQSGLQMYATVATGDKQLLDRNHTDVVASQCHYQSLKLLHSLETGNLPVFSSQLVTGSGQSNVILEAAPAVSPVKPPTEEAAQMFAFSSVHEAPRPRKEASLENNDVYAEHQEPPTVSSRLASAHIHAAEDLTPIVSSAEHDDVGISDADDFDKVAQLMCEDHAEHERSNVAISIYDAIVGYKFDHDTACSEERTPEVPVYNADYLIEADGKGPQPNVSSLQDGYDGSCMDNYAAEVGDTDDHLQTSMSMSQYTLPEETVSTELTEDLTPNISVQKQHTDVRQMSTEQRPNHDASFDEQQRVDENIKMPMSSDSETPTVQELPKEKAKKKRKNRKKKSKSPKDDLTPLETSPGCSDLPSVNQSNNIGENICEAFSPVAVEARNLDDNGLHTTTLVNAEAPDGVAYSSSKKNKKRKRTKKAGQAVADNMAVNDSIIADANMLPLAVSEAEQNVLSRVEVSISKEPDTNAFLVAETMVQQDEVKAFQEVATADMCTENKNYQSVLPPFSVSCAETIGLQSPTTDEAAVGLEMPDGTLNTEESVPRADVNATLYEEEGDVKKPVELCTQTIDVEVSNSAVDDKSALSAKPAKRKNRKKRKPKTSNVQTPGDSVKDNELDKAYDNGVLLDSLVENHEQVDDSAAAEANEILTESLEEDARITEQPLDILSVYDSRETSDPLSHYISPLKTAERKKKKRKARASKVVQPNTSIGPDSDFVTESLFEEKADPSEKVDIIDKPSVLNFSSDSASTDLMAATVLVTTGKLDKTNVSLPLSRDDECKETEKETQFEIGGSGESSSDELLLGISYAPEPVADSTVVSEDSKKRKKNRKRNREKKISQKTTFSDKPTTADNDLCSLLTQIIEICVETKHSRAAESDNQPQYSKPGKHDTDASHIVQAPKALRKPRKYQRSKPIRLPPDVAERPAEAVASGSDKTSAGTSSTHALQSSGTRHLEMRPATEISAETRSDFPESLKFPKSPSQMSTEDVVNDPSMMQDVEDTDTMIAFSASTLKTSDLPYEYSWPRSLPDTVSADPHECQLTDVSEFPVSSNIEDTVVDSDELLVCAVDMTQTELQETCMEDERKLTSDEFQNVTVNQTCPLNIDGCLTADVFTVISEDTNLAEANDIANFSSELNDDSEFIKPVTVAADNQQVVDCKHSVGITEQNLNHCWLDGDELLQAPTSNGCETSSVDSEVERIFAGHVADDAVDGSSPVEEGVCSDWDNDGYDEELAIEDDDLVVTEYIDLEIIEETETVTILDDDADLPPSISDRHSLDAEDTPHESKCIVSSTSPRYDSGRIKESTEDAVQFQPCTFTLQENEDKSQLTGLPSDVTADNMKVPTVGPEAHAHDGRGQQLFSSYCATRDRPTFHWPPTSEERAAKSDVTGFLGLQGFSRKWQHPVDDTSSSDSTDDKQGSGDSQFIIAQHQPVSAAKAFAADPAWPFLAGNTHWSTYDDVIDTPFADTFSSEQNPARATAKPLDRPRQNVDVHDGSVFVHQEQESSQDEELSGDSLNENSSAAIGAFLEEPRTFAMSSGPVQASFGETWESCSTDSLDFQTKVGPVIELCERGRSSTDYISEDSLAESRFVDREDNSDLTAVRSTKVDTASSTEADGKQRQDAGRARVSARPKRFSGVRARFKCPKPGVAVKTSRKRKLGNVTKDGSDSGETDTDSAQVE